MVSTGNNFEEIKDCHDAAADSANSVELVVYSLLLFYFFKKSCASLRGSVHSHIMKQIHS